MKSYRDRGIQREEGVGRRREGKRKEGREVVERGGDAREGGGGGGEGGQVRGQRGGGEGVPVTGRGMENSILGVPSYRGSLTTPSSVAALME